MPVDVLTKSDVAKANYALTHLLKTSRRRLLDEGAEMQERRNGKHKPGRSQAASRNSLEPDGVTARDASGVGEHSGARHRGSSRWELVLMNGISVCAHCSAVGRSLSYRIRVD